MEPYAFQIRLYQGDSIPLVITMDVDGANTQQDLTGFSVKLYIKDQQFTASIEKTQALFRLASSQTALLPVGTHKAWIQITKGQQKQSFKGKAFVMKGRE